MDAESSQIGDNTVNSKELGRNEEVEIAGGVSEPQIVCDNLALVTMIPGETKPELDGLYIMMITDRVDP